MRTQSKIQLFLVALVCVGPLLAAYVLYYGGAPAELPRLQNPERELLDPVVELPRVDGRAGGEPVEHALGGPRWSLMYATEAASCDERCVANMIRLRQVYLTLGRDQSRVQRVYASTGEDSTMAADPELVTVRLDAEQGQVLLGLLESVGLPPGHAGRLYVADPHGNLVLSYPADADQEGLRDDLKRLLRVSSIG